MKIKLLIIILVVIVLTILLFFVLYKTYKEKYTIDKQNIPDKIDIVYTWVEATPEFNKEKEYWYEKETDKNYEKPSDIRYKDQEELKYSLRSIEKYFPNYNNIYLIVKDNQYPKYLKRQNNKLHIIKHSDIIPKEYLPTFNSRAIEAYLHHIPNLSEYYIYCNDDVMFLKTTDPSYFIDNRGIPYTIFTNTKINKENNNSLNLNSNSFRCGLSFNSNILDKITKEEDRYEISHSPMIYRKSYDYEIEKFFKKYYNDNENINAFDKTGMSRFRRCDDLYLVSVIKPYLYKNWFDSKSKESESTFVKDFNPNNKIDSRFLNMEFVNNNNDYINFMNKKYKEKSSFEI
jgi:hypothetical protein